MRRRLRFFSVCLGALFITGLIFSGTLVPNGLAAEKPLRIGFSMALSGGLAAAGKAALLSMQICAEDFNKKGGVLGRPVELVYYDDHSKPADVPGIYTKLITVDKVDFVLSPYATAPMAAAMPIVMKHKLVFISLFGLAINKAFNYKYYFGIMPAGPEPYIGWSEGFFEIASQQKPKPKTVALLGEDHEYGVNGQIGAEENAKKFGMKVIYKKLYPPATVDCTPLMRAIKAVNPDIVWFSTYPGGTVCTIKAAKEVGLKPKMIGGGWVGAQYTSIQTSLGPDMNGTIFYHMWVPAPTLKFPGIEEFLKKYQAQAGKEGLDPLGYYLPPWGYAYLQVLLQAIEASKSTEQETVGEYIRNNWFETVVGRLKFAPNGEWWQSRMFQVQVQGVKSHDVSEFAKEGTFVVLSPKKWASGKIIYPFPGWKK
jgi:branched-chain amino acid transport system substrate-binding protein